MSRQSRNGRPRRKKFFLHAPHPGVLFSVPPHSFYTLPDLELRGGTLSAQGCRKVLDFTPTKVCLDFGSTLLTFYGCGFKIESLVGKRLILSGQFVRIELSAKWLTDERGPEL